MHSIYYFLFVLDDDTPDKAKESRSYILHGKHNLHIIRNNTD